MIMPPGTKQIDEWGGAAFALPRHFRQNVTTGSFGGGFGDHSLAGLLAHEFSAKILYRVVLAENCLVSLILGSKIIA